ncbi:MAG: VWA domain-containing protein [Aureliella sp.]
MLPTQTRHRRGAMILMVAVVLVILLMGAVFTIDIAYMHMVRSEMRTATDAAAQAGSEALARTQDRAAARQAAIDIASRNQIAGRPLTLQDSDIEIGGVRPGSRVGRLEFDAAAANQTAVRVTANRTAGSADGEVPLFFARLFGAQAFQPTQVATATANVRDIALVLDVSGSMNSRSGGQTRLAALKDAVNVFIDEIEANAPASLLSLSIYSTRARKRIDLTDNYSQVRTQVAGLRASGLTAIGQGLQMASDSLENDSLARPFAAKSVILMTDGRHNRGINPLAVAPGVVARGHSIHTVTFSSGADQSLMQQVAALAPIGSHIHADSSSDLSEAFREIARSLFVTLVE